MDGVIVGASRNQIGQWPLLLLPLGAAAHCEEPFNENKAVEGSDCTNEV